MLESCFIHIPKVGPAFVEKMNAFGIFTWDDALSMSLPCSGERAAQVRAHLHESKKRLQSNDALWFGNALRPAEQWWLYPHFCHSAAYVDIETTGLSFPDDAITTIALYDGNSVRTYVQGVNLEDFATDIQEYKLLVTWNGRSFDAPVLRRYLHIPLDKGNMAHLDLLPVFRALGLKGGLKKVEKRLGLDREALDGVDGYTAVLLWREYERTQNPKALETLLAYNVADVLSLEVLAKYAVMHHQQPSCSTPSHIPIFSTLEPVTAPNPFSVDLPTLRKVLSSSFY